jgi:hypothetical protein
MYKTCKLMFLWIGMVVLLMTACGMPGTPAASQVIATTASTAAVQSIPTAEIAPTLDPQTAAMIEAIRQKCVEIQPGQACFGQGPIQVEFQPGRKPAKFSLPGQRLNLVDVQRMKVGAAGSGDGLALLRIQTESPGQYFTVVAFGDVELVNEVPYGVREYNGMQALKLISGAGEKDGTLTSGLLVQAPDDGALSTLVVNGAELTFGSTAFLTSVAGGMTVQTLAGAVGVSSPFGLIAVAVQGTVWNVTEEQLIQSLRDNHHDFTPQEDDEFHGRMIQDALDRYFATQEEGTGAQFSQQDWPMINRALRLLGLQRGEPRPYEDPKLRSVLDLLKRELEKRRMQKPWKVGWWKRIPAGQTVSGTCKDPTMGVHQCGCECGGGQSCPNNGDNEDPYSQLIPICRGNNGNTILMYESGTSYDRIGPNLYGTSAVDEVQPLPNSEFVTKGSLQTLQIVSPTRMIETSSTAEGGGCNVSMSHELIYVRDDPAIRCGKIIDVPVSRTPPPTPPPPGTQPVEPPVEGLYPVRFGMITGTCDAAAQMYAPNFLAASLSLDPQNKLILDAASVRYELEQSSLPLRYSLSQTQDEFLRLGMFILQPSLADPFQLTMSLVQLPGQQWSGNWLVTNQDGSQKCSGSIDLFAEK